VYKVLLPEIKLPGYEPDPSQSSGEVKNAWSYASNSTILQFVHRAIFLSLKIQVIHWEM
jgi:hypothetical protein